MAGFDCQFSAPSSQESFPQKAVSFFEIAGTSLLNKEEVHLLGTAIDFQTVGRLPQAERDKYRKFVAQLPKLVEENQGALESIHGLREISFWKRIFINIQHLYVEMEFAISGKPFKPSDNNSRDLSMGETLVWLADEYYFDAVIFTDMMEPSVFAENPTVKENSPRK